MKDTDSQKVITAKYSWIERKLHTLLIYFIFLVHEKESILFLHVPNSFRKALYDFTFFFLFLNFLENGTYIIKTIFTNL